jgi:hypothetical protein
MLTIAPIPNKRDWQTGAAFSAYSSAAHQPGFHAGRNAVIGQM